LGTFTPSKLDKEVVLDSFVFSKVQGDIIKQSHMKVNIPRIATLKVTIETPLMDNIRGDLIAIGLERVAFSHDFKLSMRNMTWELKNTS
jgi:hypothetical protein